MALRAAWVGYGRPAAESLRSLIAAAKADDPLAPVTVVVSSNHVGVATRRLLASGEVGTVDRSRPGLVAVDFLTPFRLAELYGAPVMAAQGRLPVSNPVVTTAVRSVLSADPGVFAPVAAHPATEEALVSAYRELRDVPPEGLEVLARAGSKAADVVRICAAARARLAPEWYDEQDLAAAAAGVVVSAPAAHLGTVVVYLPQRLSSSMAALVRAVATDREVVVVAGTVGDPGADHEVVASVGRLGLDGPPPGAAGPAAVYSSGATEIVTASDADEEVRQAVRRVVQAIRSGARGDRIAVLYPTTEPYARLVHEHLRAAVIPANGAAVIPLKERVASRTLLSIGDLHAGDYTRTEVMAWLAAAPLLDDGHVLPVPAWERLARQAGVVRGRQQWDARLAVLESDYRRVAAGPTDAPSPADPQPPSDARIEAAGRRAELVGGLRRFVLDLIERISEASHGTAKWSERSSWAGELLDGWFGPAGDRSAGWPDEEARAYLRLTRALDRLAALDRISGPVGLDVFLRTLELELDDDLGRTGRLGEGVLVGPVGLGVGLDLDLLVVLGMAEGSFPTAVRDDSLLSDSERCRVAGGHLPLRRDMVSRQHRLLLASAASARRQLLCLPRGDLRATTQRMPSRWLLDAVAALGRAPGQRGIMPPGDGVTEVASFLAGVAGASFASTDQERRLQELLVEPAGVDDGIYRAGRQVVMARKSRSFTRFDGNLAGVPVPSPVGQTLSATRLESWVACPHAYFMRYVLGVRDLEEPSEESRITPLDRGSLIHEALERFVKEAGPDRRPWDGSDRDRMARIAAEVCLAYERRGVTGRPLYWSSDRRRIHADLDRFVTEDILAGAGAGTWPVAAEHRFDAAVLDLPDGRSIRLQGMIDRIDTSASGAVTVVDYKTGRAEPYRHIDTSDPGGSGAHLQLVIYALAARDHLGVDDVSAYYWMVSALGGWGRYGYRVDDEVIGKVAATVQRIVEGIEQGVFPAHPTRSSTSPWPNCDYCDLDGMGETELRRAWERKRTDPAMAAYRDLVEPADG